MTKAGIRISQQGISVDRAADYQKTMDERWPVVEMLFQGVVDLKDVRTTTAATLEFVPIYKHNLGYLPAYRFLGISSVNVDTFENLASNVYADETYIYYLVFKDAGTIKTFDIKFWLAVFDRDCSQEYQAPIDIVTGIQKEAASAYGIKIKNNPSSTGMNERDKTNYSFNSNAKSLAIQQHGLRTADASTNNQLIIRHNLGYPPTYLVAKKTLEFGSANPFQGRRLMEPLNNGSGISKNNSLELTISGAQAVLQGDYIFIILKDPVDLAR